ncbi:single-stranded-DNA-specific exonuclease RecJ (plasmid) [Acidovorax carolinensis]|uniref:Single-stranded-DNA-specific exonuclease RecJ n=1 Tax=Acidovorax carolinensis TaxID=553814 RepID=A0A240UJH7_9BURK|nr:single-stranded-DNA-specific exonuclease RecJ [Acidovorax carolinensis]ART61179.1 single-stranded-DNA-specific exonuclease RecJ [Acidovorax carolinensis]
MSSPVILQKRPANPIAVARMRARGVDEILARLYVSRGITESSEISGGMSDLLPGDSMKNVTAMACYLADCAVTHKRVLIVSDYDCDGATACAVLAMAFMGCGMNYEYLVPDRMKHGYGLTPAIVDEAAALATRPDVIITVDNGISSHAGVQRANEHGIDVLVTDHHLAPDVLPNAKLIVNPNQKGCTFESKNIAGCGVAWYVARALIEELIARNMDPGFEPGELLSYVALGTVADVVKLDRNNRILVAEGLKYIRSRQCAPGVLALASIAGKNITSLTCSDIGFGIGPRINAAGRLAHMSAGIECLTTLEIGTAIELAKQLNETNEERKEIQREIAEGAIVQAFNLLAMQSDEPSDEFGRRSIVVYSPDWHEGVVGVVAGRLKEDLHRPTIVMTNAADGDIKGSARSIPGFHLKHALDEINIKHPGVLLKFGGHAMAAGMTIVGDKIDLFRNAFEAVCRKHLTAEIMVKRLSHDGELPEHLFTVDTIYNLSQQVWGAGFEEPVFVNTFAVDEIKTIGEDQAHLRLKARLGSTCTDVLAFGQGDMAMAVGPTITVAHKPQINTFQDDRTLQSLVELMPESLNPGMAEVLSERAAKIHEAAAARAVTQTQSLPPSSPALVEAAHVAEIPAEKASPAPAMNETPAKVRRPAPSRMSMSR